MENLSIREFKSICDALSPNEFIISTDNQTIDTLELGIRCNLSFSTMVIHTHPNSIYFKNQDSYIKFDRVKQVKKLGDSLLGNVFKIICTGFLDPKSEFVYTIIAR